MAMMNTEDDKSPNSMASGFAQAQSAQTKKADMQPRSAFSFATLGSHNPSPLSRNRTSEVLNDVMRKLDVHYSTTNDGVKIDMFPLDCQNLIQIAVSAIIVAVHYPQYRGLGVAHHVLILEGSVDESAFMPENRTIGNQMVVVPRTPGAAFDNAMLDLVRATLDKAYPGIPRLNAEASVVPRNFDTKNEDAVYNLAYTAVAACHLVLTDSNPEVPKLNLADVSNDASLIVSPVYSKDHTLDGLGQPVRSDILVRLQASQRTGGQSGVERTTNLTEVAAFIDLVYDPEVTPPQTYGQPPLETAYRAQMVITALRSTKHLSLESQLLALSTATAVSENNSWHQTYRQRVIGNRMHDIGGIAIEMNPQNNPNKIGTRIKTDADSFRPQDLADLLKMYVAPGLLVAIDVQDVGPDSCFNSVWRAAAEGRQRAIEAIMQAANNLTNGNFQRRYQEFGGNGAIAKIIGGRIHMGTYIDMDQQARDIRDFDYLANLNLNGETEPGVAATWADTFFANDVPEDVRLSKRWQLISNSLTTAKLSGFGHRVQISSVFLQALAKAIGDCGVHPRLQTNYGDLGSFTRASAGFSGSALLPGAAGGFFNTGSTAYAGGSSFYAAQGSRW